MKQHKPDNQSDYDKYMAYMRGIYENNPVPPPYRPPRFPPEFNQVYSTEASDKNYKDHEATITTTIIMVAVCLIIVAGLFLLP